MLNDSKCLSNTNRQKNTTHSQNQNDMITINLLKVRELFARYLAKINATAVSEQKLTQLLLQSKINIKQDKKDTISKQLFSREKELLRELSNLNKIKENNERILKNKIKQLEQKLWKTDEKQFKQSKKVQLQIELGILRLDLNNKQTDIFELKNIIIELQNNIENSENIINKLAKQKQQLVHKIYNLQQSFSQQELAKICTQYQLQSIETQTNEQINNNNALVFLSIEKVLDEKLWFSNRAEVKYKQREIQNNEAHRALQESNSSLRKQLLQLHEYVQEQDQRYSKNIVFLEDKIKKLTYFNKYNSRRTSMSNLSQSTGFFTPRKMLSIDESQIIRPDTNQTIKLADLKIQLELSKYECAPQIRAQRINLISPSQQKEHSFSSQQQQ